VQRNLPKISGEVACRESMYIRSNEAQVIKIFGEIMMNRSEEIYLIKAQKI
jgi:hypothetical protein